MMLEEQGPVREDPFRNLYMMLGFSHHIYRDEVHVEWDEVLSDTEF